MNELHKKLTDEFADADYAHGYMEGHIHDKLLGQIYWTRKARKWTQDQLAEKAGMTQERISKIESGDFNSITLSTLQKLARALDVNLRVGFEPFSHGVLDVGNLTKENLALPSRVDSLEQLRRSSMTIMEMYGASPLFITAVSENVETTGQDPSTSSAVTAGPATAFIVQAPKALPQKAMA